MNILLTVLKELNETLVWLQMIHRTELINPSLLKDLMNENQQLCRILWRKSKRQSATKRTINIFTDAKPML